jgi:hypothetical protein
MDEFRFMNGKQTLAFLKAGKFSREQALKLQANEKGWKRRPDVLTAFNEYLKWLDTGGGATGSGEQLELQAAPVEKSKDKKGKEA